MHAWWVKCVLSLCARAWLASCACRVATLLPAMCVPQAELEATRKVAATREEELVKEVARLKEEVGTCCDAAARLMRLVALPCVH